MTTQVPSTPRLVAGRYLLQDQVGSGAMGVVWRGVDQRLGRTVAVKQLLLPAGLDAVDAEEARQRAMREGRIAARLHHPHAIAVFDVATDYGQPWLVMEYLPSRSLAQELAERGPLPPLEVAAIGRQVADALVAAHRAGIVHRDVKPGNVLLGQNGNVKITDFGISRAAGDVTVTRTGVLAGTPAYLAPEVARGAEPGPASDVFSLGSTMYTAIEGEPPFGRGDNALALLHAVAAGRIRPPQQAGPLSAVLMRLMRAEPDERPDMATARDNLAAVLAGARPGTPGAVPPGAGRSAAAAALAAGANGLPGLLGPTPTRALPLGAGTGSAGPGSAGGIDRAADAASGPGSASGSTPAAEPAGAESSTPDAARAASTGTGDTPADPGEQSADGGPAGGGTAADEADPNIVTAVVTDEPAAGPQATRLDIMPVSGLGGYDADYPQLGPQPPFPWHGAGPAATPQQPLGQPPVALTRPRGRPTTADLAARRAAQAQAQPGRSRRPLLLALVIALVVLAVIGGVIAARVLDRNRGTTDQPPPATSTPAATSAAAPGQPGAARTTTRTPTTTHRPTTTTSTATTTASSSGEVTSTQLTGFVTGYYGLLPGNLDQGWADLGPDLKARNHNDITVYKAFWMRYSSVAPSEITADPADLRVTLTVTYTAVGGGTSQERHLLTLIHDGGGYLIDNDSQLG